jgi:hypothetical protein
MENDGHPELASGVSEAAMAKRRLGPAASILGFL